MFQPDPRTTHVPATREQIVSLVESINQPQVSIPGKPPQAVKGHLCGVRNSNGTFTVFVSLHLPKTGENVVYQHEKRQVTAQEYQAVETEGLQFLESMGFMLDNLNFRNMAPALQEATLQRMPMFGAARPPPPPDRSAPKPDRAAPKDLGRLARLLASF